MPDLIIKKVKQFGRANATLKALDFLDRNEVLFEWNNKVDESPDGILKEDMVLYPSFSAEIPGIILDQDQPIPSIKDKIKLQGRIENDAAHNTNIESFDIVAVDALTILHANNNKSGEIDDNNDNIMSIGTILLANNPNPLILPDKTDDNNTNKNDDESCNDDELSNDNLSQGGDL
jgi:hypothetical protein